MTTRGRVVITGGAGFIGSHLCERFLREGHDVVCLDNLLTGSPANIDHLLGNPKFTFARTDVDEHLEIGGPIAFLLHFASPASPKDYLQHPIETLTVGAFGTHNLLDLAEAEGAVFLLASSSEIYGDPEVNPQPESYWGRVNPVGPRSVYVEAKRFAEAMTMAYYRYHGLDTRIVRIFNTYGPRMQPDDGRVISNFIAQALRSVPLTVHGDGSQTRSFCYVDDMVDGVLKVLYRQSDRRSEQRAEQAFLFDDPLATDSIHHPINLGNPEERSIIEVAQLVLKVVGSRSEVRFVPRPVDDPQVRRPDIRRAQEMLGWKPQVALQEGIRRTVDHFQYRLRIEATNR